jgi:thiosulfate dehydrogenase
VRFIYGFVFALALLVGAGVAAIYSGALPANADSKPNFLEKWVARTALHATMNRETASLSNPLQPSDDDLRAGVKLYAENCAICHGAADGKPSNAAQGFNVKAPQLAKTDEGVEDDPDAVTFWKIKHGIRFTAMPAFGSTLSDEQIWQVASFLKKMDKLSPSIDADWKAVPSVASSAGPNVTGSAAPGAAGSAAPAPAGSANPGALSATSSPSP